MVTTPEDWRWTKCRVLPLHARWQPHTCPAPKPKPGVPVTSMVGESKFGRPPRFSRNHTPSAMARRWGDRSNAQRPVMSSVSATWSETDTTTSSDSTT